MITTPNAQLFNTVKLVLLSHVVLTLSACASYEYHATRAVDVQQVESSVAEEANENELLDVGISLFDSGLELLDEDSAAYTSVRQSEAVWFSSQLKQALEYSNAWGVVRTMPSQNLVMDLMVSGKIIESNGEAVRLHIDAVDAVRSRRFSQETCQGS